MSIKALAVELYRAQQKVDKALKAVEEASSAEEESLKRELKVVQQEWKVLRKMLDGQKESGSFRKRFTQFGSFNHAKPD